MSFPQAVLYRQGLVRWGPIVRLGQGSDVIFHPATGLDTPAIAQVQTDARRRILRAFVEEAKASGLVARLIERHHVRGLSVAAPA